MIEGSYANVPIDTPMTLLIDGIATELNGFIARRDADRTLVKFELSEEDGKIVSELVSTRRAA